MSTPTYEWKGEPSGVAGSNVLVGETDCEAKADSSTPSQVEAHEDGPFNSGELITILGDFRT